MKLLTELKFKKYEFSRMYYQILSLTSKNQSFRVLIKYNKFNLSTQENYQH